MFSLLQRSVIQLNIKKFSTVVAQLKSNHRLFALHGFDADQTQTLIKYLEPLLKNDSLRTIESSLNAWKHNLHSSKEQQFQQKFVQTILEEEPRLLLLDGDSVQERIEQLKSLDLVRGSNDVWKLFLASPTGYFLQDWSELLKKYYYITFKVLPWLEPEIKTTFVNPLVLNPKVIELEYNVIKTRFLFAQRTGFQLHKQEIPNLNTLFLVPISEYIKIYAPYCTVEEFNALEKVNVHSIGEEDDRLFEELVSLAPKKRSKNNGNKSKSFINDNLRETYLLSDIKP
ncbi:ATP-dependent RNA helicase ddx51 [Blomia tropicalis]|nr:ATP-dependent RNA helicase ddx51 [Blomia tropicalis]